MVEVFSFAGYRFDSSTGQLWSGAEEIRLTPKAAGVLAALVTRAGQPVTKEDLFSLVWRDTIVSDDSLTACIHELRKALADNAKQPFFIETRHRFGYRFVAPLVPPTTSEAREDAKRALGIENQVETFARIPDLSGKPTVAVLPFENMSGDPQQEYFSDGITEEIITALSKHRSLLVIARSSTFTFKGRDTDVRRIGMDLGADYVVEGSVGRMGQRLRVRAQLVETAGGRHIWAEQYDRDLEEIFQVQDEITAVIAGRIEPEVGAVERQRAEKKPATAFRAWDFLHLGTKHFYKATGQDNEESQRLFRRALELDSSLAAAYAWLSYSMVLSMIYFDREPNKESLMEAVDIARKGVEVDDQDALTHFAYGRALLASKAYQDALAELEAAIDLNPALAVAYCGFGDSLTYEGRFHEAIPYFEKAIRLSPHDPQRWAFYSYGALAHLFAGKFDEALDWARNAIRVPNCHYWPFAHRVAALGHLQHFDDLSSAVGDLLQRKPEFSCSFARGHLFYIKNPAHLDLYVEGLRKAGLTE